MGTALFDFPRTEIIHACEADSIERALAEAAEFGAAEDSDQVAELLELAR